MNITRIALISVVAAILVIVTVRMFPKENPLFILVFPGWSLAFGAVFVREDTFSTRVIFETIFWLVNVGIWSCVFFVILFSIIRLRAQFGKN
jgi:hypothetical protein